MEFQLDEHLSTGHWFSYSSALGTMDWKSLSGVVLKIHSSISAIAHTLIRPKCCASMQFNASNLSDSSNALHANREALLLLVGVRASSSINLVLAIVVGPAARIDIRNLILELEDVLAGGGVDESRVGLAGAVALALDVVLVLEAALAVVGVVALEGNVEAVVAASGAAKGEFVDEELAPVAAGVVLVAADGGSGGEGGGAKSEDGGGAHFDYLVVCGLEVVV